MKITCLKTGKTVDIDLEQDKVNKSLITLKVNDEKYSVSEEQLICLSEYICGEIKLDPDNFPKKIVGTRLS